jgi:hypothetical protein
VTVKTETFTGTDDAGLDGNVWATQSGCLAPKIKGNACAGSNENYGAAYRVDSGVTFENDQYAQSKLTAADMACGASVRYTAGGTGKAYNGWYGTWDTRFFCYKGTGEQMGELISMGAVAQVGDVVRVEVKGTTVEYFVNGVSVGTRTDSSLSAGAPGLFFYSLVTDEGRIDDWEGGDWAPVGPPGAVLGYLPRQFAAQ